MAGVDRKRIAREAYEAFAAGDRRFYDEHLSDDLSVEVYFGWELE